MSLCWGDHLCVGVCLEQVCLVVGIKSLCDYTMPACPHEPSIRATVTYFSDLFLLLPDVAHNLQDALGIGQPGHIFWQSLQL